MSEELFTTKMKRATRKAHAISDALVNAKLLFALNNDKVWAEALLIFYEIFKFLEIAMEKKKDENLGKLYIEEMNRTSAFEEDLNYYLGANWKKEYKTRDAVKNYLNHLEHLLDTDSDLLMAYVYHLYMGLLSGGQILQKKRSLQRKIKSCNENSGGDAVTSFKKVTISDLKSQMREKVNSVAEGLDDNKKELLIEESKKVFELNNSIIKTVKNTEIIAMRNVVSVVSINIALLGVVYYFYKKYF